MYVSIVLPYVLLLLGPEGVLVHASIVQRGLVADNRSRKNQ